MRDFYADLRVSKDATATAIKSAYKQRVLDLHPDRNASPSAHQDLVDVNEAFRILSDEDLRRRYDAIMAMSPEARAKWVSNAAGARSRAPADRAYVHVPIDFEDLFRQKEAPTDPMVQWARCGVCGGCGYVYQYFTAKCGRCAGRGFVPG